jgi:signal transduction histidine kinase
LDNTEETHMHGIFADEHRASRETRSASKLRPQISRRPHRHDDGKRRVTAEIIHAFDRPAPQRDLDRSPETSGSAPVAPAVRRHEGGQLIAHNTARYDIGNMAKSDSDGSRQFFRNGSIHDLRNLLQTVSSGVSVAESRIEEGRSGDVPAILAKIGDSVEKAGALLRQMVRIPRSSLTLKSAVDIGKMLANLEASLRWALGPRNELVIAIGPDLPPVYCVESELENVMLNLVINARDAMPNGGRVAIDVSRGARSAGGIILRIHDTGMGMDPGVAAKAFEPYFTTKSPSAGTGLGLAMVAAFARSVGGSARIEQTSPRGTTIALCLPT